MPNRFAVGKKAIAMCDRCGFQDRLTKLKALTIKTKNVNLLVCPSCWEPDQPQLQLGMYPVDDPQALRNPRPDSTYLQSGVLTDGSIGGGSRDIQWGWNPVGGGNDIVDGGTPNDLVGSAFVGTVTVTTS